MITYYPGLIAQIVFLSSYQKYHKLLIMSWLNAGINGGIPSRGSYDEDNLDEEEAIERQVSAALFFIRHGLFVYAIL